MPKAALAALALFLLALPAQAAEGVINVPSAFPVKETADRLENILKEKGLILFTRVNHAVAASGIGIELRPTELIIFGNPKLGSPLMQCAQSAAIDLPQKALIWQDAESGIWLSYNDPGYLQTRHAIGGCEAVVAQMQKALAGIAAAATAP